MVFIGSIQKLSILNLQSIKEIINPVTKIGILGGTYDPIHNGHLAIAAEVRQRLDLAEILFIPTGKPWQKADRQIAPAAYRVEMVSLAISGIDHFRLSRIEVERPGSTYTVDTLKQLKKDYGGHTDLYFILGWDALLGAPYWKDPVKIIELCYVVAVPRPGIAPPDPVALEQTIPGIKDRLIMLDIPLIDISSTDIRRRVAEGLPYEYLVPGPVAEYIKKNKLYTEEKPTVRRVRF